ncbi:hypothetical protein M407DRAFT_242728 [Tulasnella calospora MUT 4182]|uniref:Uncharacterized protein n=1 Tax=Tulasnella calospora MUT 4182 TaxID=1051891 RepID=A0A0C3L5P3_9AGAM|nr:hypothetical protein M407DRAFT_242728 [Tulasnella calospora MUT 4182]
MRSFGFGYKSGRGKSAARGCPGRRAWRGSFWATTIPFLEVASKHPLGFSAAVCACGGTGNIHHISGPPARIRIGAFTSDLAFPLPPPLPLPSKVHQPREPVRKRPS